MIELILVSGFGSLIAIMLVMDYHLVHVNNNLTELMRYIYKNIEDWKRCKNE